MLRDVTQAKRIKEALRESEAQRHYMVELSPQLRWTADPEGRVTGVNRRWLELTGLAREAALGEGWTQVVHPDDLPRVTEAWARSLRRGDSYDVELRLRLADGSFRWIRARAHPRHSPSGEVLQWYGSTEDIHDRVVNEERARALQTALRHRDRIDAMGKMVQTLAHELTQPLAAAANYVEACQTLLRGTGTETAPVQALEGLDAALAQMARTTEILRRLRRFVRPGTEERRREDLNGLVREAVSLAAVGAEQGGLRLRLDLAPSLPAVVVDAVQIQQVVVNLVRNAIEAVAGTPRRDVTIATAAAGPDVVEIAVADTGPGFPPRGGGDPFEPFTTSKTTGLGLGLPIARSIIEEHGGHLWAEGNPGGGAVFRVRLHGHERRGARR